MSFLNSKHIHFIGIGGIGVSALARISVLHGCEVSGSDQRQSVVTNTLASLGIKIFLNQAADNIGPNVDLIIHTEDVNSSSKGYVELEEAKSRGIRTLKYSEALGYFLDGFDGVAVTGTNGKSTTTAILGLILDQAGMDPMVVVGSRLAPINENEHFQGNARFGKGKHFVYEADEYHRHMLDTHPKYVVLTNIEADHLDYYGSLDEIKNAFGEFLNQLPEDGMVVFNQDDENTAEVVKKYAKCKKVSFGFNDHAKYIAKDISIDNQHQEFTILRDNIDLGRFTLSIPGRYNVLNALGAVVLAMELGLEIDTVRKSLNNFAGIWRRFEKVGSISGKPVISDYAHHPTGVVGLIKAAKEFYPDKKILLVFQPHQKHRTEVMFQEFVQALSKAEYLIVSEIFSVAGREKDPESKISSRDLVKAIGVNNINVHFAEDLNQTEKLIKEQLKDIDVIVLAGAGTVDQLARKIVD